MPEKPDQEEYELIPVSPLRKLEKRMEDVESKSGKFSGDEFLKEFVDITKMNQRLIEEMARANDSLKLELSKIPSKIDTLLGTLNELLSYVKAATVEEATSPTTVAEPLVARMNELAESNKKMVELTQTMVESLEEIDKRLKSPARPPMPPLIRRPTFQPTQQAQPQR